MNSKIKHVNSLALSNLEQIELGISSLQCPNYVKTVIYLTVTLLIYALLSAFGILLVVYANPWISISVLSTSTLYFCTLLYHIGVIEGQSCTLSDFTKMAVALPGGSLFCMSIITLIANFPMVAPSAVILLFGALLTIPYLVGFMDGRNEMDYLNQALKSDGQQTETPIYEHPDTKPRKSWADLFNEQQDEEEPHSDISPFPNPA